MVFWLAPVDDVEGQTKQKQNRKILSQQTFT